MKAFLNYTLVLLAIICMCLHSSMAAKQKLELDNSITLDVNLRSDDSMEFVITAPKKSWVAIGFGDRMKNSDLFLINPKSGVPTLTDAHSFEGYKVTEDHTNDYMLKTEFGDELNTYTVTRRLDTEDQNDFKITDGDHAMVYAYGHVDGDMRLDMNDGGDFELLINPKSMNIGLRSPSTDPTIPRRRLISGRGLFHALGSYVVWCWFSFLLITTGRYAKYFYTIRLWAHTVIGVIVLILNILVDRIQPGGGSSANALGDIHKGMAGAVTIFTILVIAIGTLTKIATVFLKHWTKIAQILRLVHMFGGYGTIVYGHVAVLSGLYLYDSPVAWLFYVHLAVFIMIYATIEVLFQLKSKWKYEDLYELEKKNLPEMSLAEFDQLIKDGKKYCLMDVYVLDISYYRFEHPGSTYVMDRNIGKDIGKYFYGSYSMEDWVKPYTHSYIAGLTVKKLAIGKIVDKVDEGIVQAKREEQSMGSHSSQRKLEGEIKDKTRHLNNVYTLESKSEIMKDTYRYRLSNHEVKFKSYYPNLDQSGRGYIINSRQNQVSRYYTICNCMNQKYYEIYMDAFDSVLEDRDMTLKPTDPIHEEYDDFIEFIIKVYYETKIGLAKQIDNATGDDKFIVDGPMGKNLDFGMPNPEGTYLLFVGGTGILPYMDIFAYMARKIIAEKTNLGQIFPGETFDCDLSKVNFIVYGYYPDEPRACGYEFTKKVADVFEKLGVPEQFKFNCVFTRAGGKRLNKEDLKDLLEKHAQNDNVKRVWVCGPPTMNNMFHKYMSMVKDTLKIEEEHIDIL